MPVWEINIEEQSASRDGSVAAYRLAFAGIPDEEQGKALRVWLLHRRYGTSFQPTNTYSRCVYQSTSATNR